MPPEHRAQITWSDAQVRAGLPTFLETTDPAWFDGDPPDADGWSVVCRFTEPPRVQGNPTPAWVRLMMVHAPHERLRPGARLRLYERGTGERAALEILG
jgi:hypothetical protein